MCAPCVPRLTPAKRVGRCIRGVAKSENIASNLYCSLSGGYLSTNETAESRLEADTEWKFFCVSFNSLNGACVIPLPARPRAGYLKSKSNWNGKCLLEWVCDWIHCGEQREERVGSRELTLNVRCSLVCSGTVSVCFGSHVFSGGSLRVSLVSFNGSHDNQSLQCIPSVYVLNDLYGWGVLAMYCMWFNSLTHAWFDSLMCMKRWSDLIQWKSDLIH